MGRHKHAISTTRKASSRVKQEHKVTISTKTVTGTSEASTRPLTNSSPIDPILDGRRFRLEKLKKKSIGRMPGTFEYL